MNLRIICVRPDVKLVVIRSLSLNKASDRHLINRVFRGLRIGEVPWFLQTYLKNDYGISNINMTISYFCLSSEIVGNSSKTSSLKANIDVVAFS